MIVHGFQCLLDLLDIRLQNRRQDLAPVNPSVGHFHTLDRIQLGTHQFSQCFLEFGIAFISKLCCETDNR